MSNKNLFKEAIADAKAVREAALANAKAALEEALTPKLQSMLAAKLQEMESEDEDLDEAKKSEEEKVEEGMYPENTTDPIQDRERAKGFSLEETEDLDEDFDLSEILAELEDDTVDEAKKEEDEEEGEAEEGESEEEEADEEEPTGEEDEETEEEEVEVKDMSVEDLKNLIKDIVSQEVGGGDEMSAEEPMNMDLGNEAPAADMGGEEEIDLEELLAELDALDETDDKDQDDVMDEAKGGAKKFAWKDTTKAKPTVVKAKAMKESTELDEAIATIQTLRNELNEVNLLNAKLLYVNKLFKANSLTESQKVKVIASFDKATNVKEAKAVFEALQENLKPAKKAIKESLGFASKAAGVAPKKTIVESNDVISRMQKLANIIK